MVSVAGNLYSLPDCTRRRIVEVQVTATQVQILENGALIANHPVLEGRGRRRLLEGHRTLPPPANSTVNRYGAAPLPKPPGRTVTPRDLTIYDAIGRRLADQGARP